MIRWVDSQGYETDETGALRVTDSGVNTGLAVPEHDYIGLTYTGSNLTTVVYKTGGSSGTTVATLTLAYTGSDLTSVTKS
jgi:hypothetical protein